eukprot:4236256-Amphidinium_carterae.1
MTRQACRRLKKRKQKKRRTGFRTTEVRITDLDGAPSQGGALGSAAGGVSGNRHSPGLTTGEPAFPPNEVLGRPGPRLYWPIFRLSQREPD